MTVIKRRQQAVEYPRSSNASDIDSLDIQSAGTSDAESITGDTSMRPRNAPRSINLSDECPCKKGYIGRRKRRLFSNNGIILQTLAESEEINGSYIQLMDNYKNPFERLMENKAALKFWNEFSELSEEDQDKYLNPTKSPRRLFNHDQEDPSTKISSKVKRAMKIKKNVPFELIEDIEKNMLKHFEKVPFDLYSTSPKNSFERFMLHAIAQYHNLQSLGINGSWPPCIQVFTDDNKWKPTELLFCDIIKNLQK